MSEGQNPKSTGLDTKSVQDLLALMLESDASVAAAVRACLPELEMAVLSAAGTIRRGGSVFYIGAGTSGRLGMMDAAEVMPTFGSDGFKAIIAGGESAVSTAVEGAEDDEDAGTAAASVIGPDDMAVGISASGRTPFVLAALGAAKDSGANCWLITSADGISHGFLDGVISAPTGPELIAGSTRLKAATAAKLVLNMLSTATMIRLGHVHDGLMVDVQPTNRKLVARAEAIIMEITGARPEEAAGALKESGMRPKVASLMIFKSLSRDEAEALLAEHQGSLRRALAS